MALELRHEVRDVAVLVSASGEVDSGTVDAFGSSLAGALDAATSHPAKKLVIELDDVTYFGSAGLNAVLACYERGASDGVAVRVVAANPEVIRPIEVTKLDAVLRPYDSVSAAVDGV
ncbi:MAG TPA: STAS domain-containing protein [Actinomycetes bacterium]|nr:STAS domain-containing protein [Actinomycetes bacterium]